MNCWKRRSDEFAEKECAKFYAEKNGRPSLTPGIYFCCMALEAAWHPDNKRISMWVDDDNPGPTPDFWTVPLAGGVAVRTEVPHDVARQLEGAALEGIQEWASEFAFFWAPSGKALYFPLTLRGAVNLWNDG